MMIIKTKVQEFSKSVTHKLEMKADHLLHFIVGKIPP